MRRFFPRFPWLGLVVIAVLWGCRAGSTAAPDTPLPVASPSTSPTATQGLPAEETQPPALVVEDVHWYQEDAHWTVAGVVTNYTDQAYSGVTLSLTLLDGAGQAQTSGTMYLLVDTIAPGETMPFV